MIKQQIWEYKNQKQLTQQLQGPNKARKSGFQTILRERSSQMEDT